MTVWQPVSACGATCREGAATRVSPLLVALRVAGLLGVLVIGIVIVPLRRSALPAVARALLAVLGVRLNRRGPAPRPGSLLVANHVSWLDIVALVATEPVRLVAKHDVRAWPVIGRLARRGGTVFLDRSRPKTLIRSVAEVAGALRARQSVAVFPEGTTFCGAEFGRFRPAMFQASVDTGAPIVPISIRYGSTAAAFVGDDTLWSSVCRVAALPHLTITLITSPALRPGPGASRRTLARAAEASVGGRTALGLAA